MTVEHLFCKCVMLPIRYFHSTRQQLYANARKLPRKRVHYAKQLLPTSVTAFSQLFDCPYHQALAILQKHNTLRDFTVDRLQKAISICDRLGIDKEEILKNPDVLAIHPLTIEQHSFLLEEGGFTKVGAHVLINYIPVIKKRISLLKAYGYIPPETDVPQHFLSYMEPEIRAVRIPHTLTDSESSFIEASMAALRHYLLWRLQVEPNQMEAIFKTYTRLKHKSFRLMRRSLDILEYDIRFTKEKILKNGFLIHSQPDNLEEILNTVHHIGGIPVREVMLKQPKICMTSAETIRETLRHCKTFGISDEAVRRCPEILTLSSISVHQRLSYLKVVPEFSALITHPRILRLVHYQRKARSRLEYLQQMRMKCASLHILSTAKIQFEKFAKEGADKTKGTDLSFFLSQELGYTEQSIRSSLARHPFWCHVPLVAARETLDFLFLKGFTKQQINSSLHILLYPASRVKSELENLCNYPELSEENLVPLSPEWRYDRVKFPNKTDVSSSDEGDSSSDEDDSERSSAPRGSERSSVPRDSERSSADERGAESVAEWLTSTSESVVFVPSRAKRDLRLDFCIYFIEKEHHFTGNGIWTQGTTRPEVAASLARVPAYRDRAV